MAKSKTATTKKSDSGTKTRVKGATATKTAKKATKKSPSSAKQSRGDEEVTIDRRRSAGRRDELGTDATKPTKVAKPKLERREKVQRRRQIDPTTCERDYSDLEVEFMNALDEYKRRNGRMFPTCSEVLEVILNLGYVKLTPNELALRRQTEQLTNSENPLEDEANFGTDEDADEEATSLCGAKDYQLS